VSYLISNIPHFKCWVRKEFTVNHQRYHGEFLHAIAIAVNTIPDRSLSFQVVFTGCEAEDDEANIHGGAMWARMPIQALVADIPVIVMDRVSSSPWICKINNKFYQGKYLFTVDYTGNSIADCPAQHKQSHVIYITEDCEWKGNIVALPNNRVRATSPALWVTGEGPPDFAPSQHIHSAEGHESYLDPLTTFNNLYSEQIEEE
jgi:hypothetical protein